MSDTPENGTYYTEIQCEHCLEYFDVEFDDPDESFSATCPHCDAYYPEVFA